ncbi:MAG: alpha/beta hydrolase [Desulfocapsaceae bacterium]|jgi:predicted esterase|nr:alpha/beta hydrolase [Desulfocapsaceae bacterium]
MNTIFLHGLDSSGRGTKGSYFAKHFPTMLRPDFEGSLSERMSQLTTVIAGLNELIIVGSSFGGLMGACLCREQPEKVKRLIMLAPALNFGEYRIPDSKVTTESLLVIGKEDTVTPPEAVIPAAKATFSQLQIQLVDDDHLLHHYFYQMDWPTLLDT